MFAICFGCKHKTSDFLFKLSLLRFVNHFGTFIELYLSNILLNYLRASDERPYGIDCARGNILHSIIIFNFTFSIFNLQKATADFNFLPWLFCWLLSCVISVYVTAILFFVVCFFCKIDDIACAMGTFCGFDINITETERTLFCWGSFFGFRLFAE